MQTLIDPTKVTDFNRGDSELELFMMFCILVAGKNSKVQAKKLDQFLDSANYPFCYLDSLVESGLLRQQMEHHKLGQYGRLERVFEKLLDLSEERIDFLRVVTVEELEKVVGMKTARFFIVHSRKDCQAAILDTHILAHLRSLGYDAPKATPTSKKQYARWEKVVLDLVAESGKTYADWDLDVWKARSQKEA